MTHPHTQPSSLLCFYLEQYIKTCPTGPQLQEAIRYAFTFNDCDQPNNIKEWAETHGYGSNYTWIMNIIKPPRPSQHPPLAEAIIGMIKDAAIQALPSQTPQTETTQ